MSSLTIRHKIWVSFSLLVVLLIAVGVITFANLQANAKKLGDLVNDVQPTVLVSMNLIDQLDRASASLRLYLLSKEEVHKRDYLLYLEKIRNSMSSLRQMPLVSGDTTTAALVDRVAQQVARLESYRDHMLELAINDAKNVPAMRFAGQEANPHIQVMLQALQQMIDSEAEEETSAERKLLLDIYNLRYVLLGAINELRLFLAFRAEEQIDNFAAHRELAEQAFEKIKAYDEDMFTFEQIDALETLDETFTAYFEAADQLIEIHRADGWRQDVYIIRKEISPLLLEVQDSLSRMVEAQQEKSVAESRALTAQVSQTQSLIGALIGVGLLSAILVGSLLPRAITRPILSLKASTAELAEGNLEQEIDTSRKDELGSLAQSFVQMRDAIRRKISDLHTLNTTGEELAGLHSQTRALETALRVMGEQTNVAWGSVYLLDEESRELHIKAFYPEKTPAPKHQPRTFPVGEGIAGKAAADREVIFIPDTSKDSSYVADGRTEEAPRAIISVPLVDEGRLVGVMNFSGEVGSVKFEETDAVFAATIARMTVVTSKNIQMLNVIEEHNRALEQKVQERTAELRRKTNDINNMLQNMHEGIFTILADNSVHAEYSAYLEQILETQKIAGTDAMQLLFADSDVSSSAVDQIKSVLAKVLGEDVMMFDLNRHLLVEEFRREMPDGRTRTLELDWDPIDSGDGTVEKIMVTVRDVTEVRGLHAEAEKQKWELEVIGQILAVSKTKFVDFVAGANEFLAENEKLIEETTAADPDVIALLFRNLHTLEGNARTHGFNFVTHAVHEAEQSYDELRKNPDAEWNPQSLLDGLARVRELVQAYDRIYQEKSAGSGTEGVFVDAGLFNRARQAL